MTSVSTSPPQPYCRFTSNWISISHGSYSLSLSAPILQTSSRYPKLRVFRSGSGSGKFASQDSFGSDFVLRKPSVIPVVDDEIERRDAGYDESGATDDWENRILEETVPIVGFVRTILHSGK